MDTADKEKQTDGGEESAEAEDETGERSEGFSCFGKLIVIFLMGTTIWNWDGLWYDHCYDKSDNLYRLGKIFPSECMAQKMRKKHLERNELLVSNISLEARQQLKAKKETENELEEACAYLLEAAAMYRRERNEKTEGVSCKQGSRPNRCREIKEEDQKIYDICRQ